MSEKAEAEARRIYESFGCMEIWDFAKVIDDVIAAAEKRGRVAGLREAAYEVVKREIVLGYDEEAMAFFDLDLMALADKDVQ